MSISGKREDWDPTPRAPSARRRGDRVSVNKDRRRGKPVKTQKKKKEPSGGKRKGGEER